MRKTRKRKRRWEILLDRGLLRVWWNPWWRNELSSQWAWWKSFHVLHTQRWSWWRSSKDIDIEILLLRKMKIIIISRVFQKIQWWGNPSNIRVVGLNSAHRFSNHSNKYFLLDLMSRNLQLKRSPKQTQTCPKICLKIEFAIWVICWVTDDPNWFYE